MGTQHMARLLLVIVAIAAGSLAQGAVLTAASEADALHVNVDGHRILSYVWKDSTIARPYFANLRTLDGVPVTRTHPPDTIEDAGNDDHAT
ncbi:MAG: hypothetical protein IT368_04005, partial [Candidatus Hydrogenedentes bacterium]|nr:hypothetical protein [Candidatus Hydrogenedentota bacterium]